LWKAAGSTVNGTTKRQTFTATSGQTTFSVTGGYDPGFVDVYLNGVKLVNGTGVNVSSGTNVVLSSGATAGQTVDVVAYGTFLVANTYTQAEADALLAAKANQATTYTKTEVDGLLVTATPAGTVIHVAMNTAPTGYLKANGAAVSRTTYAALFAAIGTTFGAGDGSTTFLLTDLRGEFVRGWDDGRGVDSGRAFGSAQAGEFGSHTHSGSTAAVRYNNATGASGSGFTVRNLNAGGSQTETMNATISSAGGTETRPRNVALLACIKF
jgi:phage-related tail fiber protein